ncbi:hypothetical protein BJ165DRAFT_1427322 [Panaeolus papilionaceus]|nr:hypothetical protein BJ165DRAFT_1427322 [Panaeolus papilionaceus]
MFKLARSAFAPRSVVYNCLDTANKNVLTFAKQNPQARELLNTTVFTKGLDGSTLGKGITAGFNKMDMDAFNQDPEMKKMLEQMALSANTFEITDLTQAVEKKFGIDYSMMVKYLDEKPDGSPVYRLVQFLIQAKFFDTSKPPTVGLITATNTDGHQMETMGQTFAKHKEFAKAANFVVDGATPGQTIPVELSIFPGYFIMNDTQNYLIHLEQVKYATDSLSFDMADSNIIMTNSALDKAILRLMIKKKEEYEWSRTMKIFLVDHKYIGTGGTIVPF